jgi:hypothetical protein
MGFTVFGGFALQMKIWNHFPHVAFLSIISLLGIGTSLEAATPQPAGGIFAQSDSPVTQIFWRGETLIEHDTINYLMGKTFADTGKMKRTNLGEWKIINVTSKNPNLQYRKEVAVRSDRVELTVQMNLPAFKNTLSMPSLTYSFDVPLNRLAGMKWTSLSGYSGELKKAEGQLTAQTPDGKFAGELTRWIAFEGQNKNIVFDLNPKGITPYVSISNDMAVWWDVVKKGNIVQFSISGGGREWGGVATGKMIIFEGTQKDYANHHSGNPYWYFSVIPSRYDFSFGSLPQSKEYRPVDTVKFDPEKGYGWAASEGLQQIDSKKQSLVFNGVTSTKDNTFLCRLDEPGLYIVRILSSNCTKEPFGPFAVSSNDKVKMEKLSVAPGKVKTVTFTEWLPAGIYRLGLKGNWILSDISFQMLLHREEDFSFNRGVWLVKDEYEPTPINSSQIFQPAPKYETAVAEFDLPPEKLTEPTTVPTISKEETALPDQKSPAMAWRYDGFVGGMGPDNNGTFLEFDTPEKITRRLKELKALGINVVLLNGFLTRHCHDFHQDRVTKTVAQTVKIAHSLGMKVLDHIELTILWNHEASLRVLTEHPDWFQRSVDTDTLLQGLCPLNPAYRKYWFDRVKKHIDATGIDGIMIDEVAYHSKLSCGCEYCRAKFTKDTNLVLPIGENVSPFDTKKSLLHNIWMDWRQKEMGDWWIEFRKEVLKDRPNFCIMGYVCEAGILSDYDFQFAYDLFAMARGNDFVGTEIMSSNVMDNYRYVFATRRLYNLFREEYASPVWGLVYHQYDEYFAYFGWAMNNMLGQATWDCYPIANRPHTPNFLHWPGNMDKRLAKQIAEIAIIFPVKSRNFSPFEMPGFDSLGISQVLSDNHIPHRFLTEISLENVDRLRDFHLLILPSNSCLSDREIQTVCEFAENGGTVLLTGYTGLLDSYGQPRSKWAFADLLNCSVSSENTWPSGTQIFWADKTGRTPYSRPLLKIELGEKPVDILMNAFSPDGRILGPACISQNVGKGRIIYLAAQPGTGCYQRDFRKDEKWTYELDRPMSELLLNLVKQAWGNRPMNFSPVKMPTKVITTLWAEDTAHGRKTTIHLLNATGTRIQKGDTVDNCKSLPAFPALTDDLVFEVDLPAFSKGYVTSPDYQGHKKIEVEKVGRFRYRVTVPKEALLAYSVVVLD